MKFTIQGKYGDKLKSNLIGLAYTYDIIIHNIKIEKRNLNNYILSFSCNDVEIIMMEDFINIAHNKYKICNYYNYYALLQYRLVYESLINSEKCIRIPATNYYASIGEQEKSDLLIENQHNSDYFENGYEIWGFKLGETEKKIFEYNREYFFIVPVSSNESHLLMGLTIDKKLQFVNNDSCYLQRTIEKPKIKKPKIT